MERTLTRVCLLTDTFHPVVGGGETYARSIARQLQELGVPVFVLTRRVVPASPEEERVDGVRVVRVPPTGPQRSGKYLMLGPVAWRLVRMRGDYDVILASNFRAVGPLAVGMGRLLGKRVVLRAGICGEFSGDYVAAGGGGGRAPRWLALPLEARRALLRRADGFVANCEAVTEEFRRGGAPPGRIHLLPGGVDTERYHPVYAGRKKLVRERLGLPVERFLVGYSGKLNRGKGLEHLVAAWPALRARHPDLHLVLIGGGAHQTLSQEEALRAQVRELGVAEHVTFTGYVENVPEYLQSLDLFVLPTEYEALPNALMEAMACGLPCVASRVGGIPDLVEDGVSGRLVAPGDPEALVRAVSELRDDPALAERLAAAGRGRMESHYAQSALARRLETLLRELAGEVRHARR